jgi:hypothetical protein
MPPDLFTHALALFDQANSEDPNRTTIDGVEYPNELLYAQRMTAWLEKLEPNASEPLRLAARCQHIRRWSIPRGSYPMTRAGYHQWRTALYDFHAQLAASLLEQAGYDDVTIQRVRSLVRKEHLKDDPDMQTLEDVICLVFLESYFSGFASRHDEDKLVKILQRTWKKMSDRGHQAALQLPLSDSDRKLIEKALSE